MLETDCPLELEGLAPSTTVATLEALWIVRFSALSHDELACSFCGTGAFGNGC